MPQLEFHSLNSILICKKLIILVWSVACVEPQSAQQDKRADFKRIRNGRAGLWHDCIVLGRRSYHRFVTNWEQFGNVF
jgi:hypothetical protein